MALFDLSLDELWRYRPAGTPPADLDDFWADTLAAARAAARAPVLTRVVTGLRAVRTYDVTFTGFAGQEVKGWLTVPADAGPDARLPVAVEFIGYGGGRGLPLQWLLWPAAGYAHLVMDTRGQGGDTPDPGPDGSGPSVPGYLTRGVLDPRTLYYRRLFADAARAVETAAELPGVDPSRLFTVGGSQGGGLALAAASLVPERVSAVVAGVPFLCHIRRAVTITDEHPYVEVARFCLAHRDRAATALATLDYIDVLHLVPRATAPALVSVGLMDQVCPPSTVFAAFHAYAGPKELAVYEFDGHQGGGPVFARRALEFVAGQLGGAGQPG